MYYPKFQPISFSSMSNRNKHAGTPAARPSNFFKRLSGLVEGRVSKTKQKLMELLDAAGKSKREVSLAALSLAALAGCGGGGGGGGSSAPENPNNVPTVTSHLTLPAIEDLPTTVTLAELKSHLADADGDALTLVSVAPRTTNGGTVAIATAPNSSTVIGVTVTTPANFYGADYATARFTDNHGGYVDLPIDINVANTADLLSGPDVDFPTVAESASNAPTVIRVTEAQILAGVVSSDGGTPHVYAVYDPVNGGTATREAGTGDYLFTMPAYWHGGTTSLVSYFETIPAAVGAADSAKGGPLLAYLPRTDDSGIMSDASPSSFQVDPSAYAGQPVFTRRFNFTVTHTNHSPNGSNGTLALDAALFTGSKSVNLRTLLGVADPDGDVVTFSILTQGTKGTATLAGDVLTYSPAAGQIGADQVVVRLTDNGTPTVGTRDVTLDVTAIDTMAPVLSDAAYSSTLPTKNPVTVTFTSDKLIPTPAGWNYASVAGVHTFTRTVAANESGAFATLDAAGAAVSKPWAVANIDTVVPVISAPTLVPNADGTVTAIVAATVDQNYKKDVTATAGWTVVGPTGNTYTVTKTFAANNAPAGETLRITDALGNYTETTVVVSTVDQAPTANDFTLAIAPALFSPATAIDWRAASAAADLDGDAITAAVLTQGAKGVSTLAGDTLTYSPAAGMIGSDTVVLRLSSGRLTKDVTVTVTGVDTLAPVLSDAAYSNAAPTKNPVTVTFTSSKMFAAPTGWSYANVAGVHTYTQAFAANASGVFATVDAAGATVSKPFAVANIDTVVPAVSAPTRSVLADNTVDMTVAVAVDHAYKQPLAVTAGWTLSAPIAVGGQFVYTARKNFTQDSLNQTVTFTDALGNQSQVTLDAVLPLVPAADGVDLAILNLGKGRTGTGSVTFTKNVTGPVTVRLVDEATHATSVDGSVTATVSGSTVSLAIVNPGVQGEAGARFISVEITTGSIDPEGGLAQVYESAVYRLNP